jgi:4-hydroxybenzoate polyprenyltransferase
MIGFISWIGAALMVAASFNMATQLGPMLAIIGLICLTIQAVYNRTNNLIALNICSILGFLYSLLGTTL